MSGTISARSLRPAGRRAVVWVALVPAVVAAVAGGAGLTRHGLAESEAASTFAARLSYPQLRHLLSHLDLVHAFYYASMHLLILLGGGVVAMRSVSLVATVLAAALIGLLGRRLTGSAISGLLAGLLFALSPIVDAFAKTARSYGIMPLLVVLSVVALLRGTDRTADTEARSAYTTWAPYFVALLVTVYLHELSLLLLPAFAVTLLLLRVERRVWQAWALVSAAVVVLALPLLYYTHREDKAVAWLSSPGWHGFLAVLHTYAGQSEITEAVFLIGGAVAIGAAVRARRGDPGAPGDRRLAAVALPIAIIPAALLVIESVVALPLFDVRYVCYYEPAVALAVGHGLACLGRGAVRLVPRGTRGGLPRWASSAAALAVGLAGVLIVLAVQFPLLHRLTKPIAYRGDYITIVDQIDSRAVPGDGIAYLPASLRYLPDGYPRLRRLDDFALRRSPTAAGNFSGSPRPVAQVLRRLATHRRVFTVIKPSKYLNPLARSQLDALQRDYATVRRWHDHSIVVTLWVRRRT